MTIDSASRSPSRVAVRPKGPRSVEKSGSPGRVKTSGSDDEGEGQHDPGPAHQPAWTEAGQQRRCRQHDEHDAVGDDGAGRQQRDGHDGRPGQDQLEAGVEAMDGAVARDVPVKVHV